MNLDFQKRYPNSRKTYFYKKTRVEKYAPYSMKDGIVLKVSEFADYDCELELFHSSLLILFSISQGINLRHAKIRTPSR